MGRLCARVWGVMDTATFENICRSRELIAANSGPSVVAVVSGREADRSYWESRLARTSQALFRGDGQARVLSLIEGVPKGNFLGTLNAWQPLQAARQAPDAPVDPIAFISMMFGQGTRLSPFTQALGNCKPRFPTPYREPSTGEYLTSGELSALYSNWLVDYLRRSGFQGCIVKWGDETIVPSVDLGRLATDLSQVDAIRFGWKTLPTPELAREKDWILVDRASGDMQFQFSRQAIDALHDRAGAKQTERGITTDLAVNLGSLAMSADFLNIAQDVFGADVANDANAIDWDPYTWIALACRDEREWLREIETSQDAGETGMAAFQARYPDFFSQILSVRAQLEAKNGRPLRVHVLDFGEPLWVDFGLHLTLRSNLEDTIGDGERSRLLRALFCLPEPDPSSGNIIVDSVIEPGYDVRDSLVLDSTLAGGAGQIHRGIVIGSRHRNIRMPFGGVSLFSTVPDLKTTGPHAIAFQSVEPALTLDEGGRHTTVRTRDRTLNVHGSERITTYKGEPYDGPVLGNEISFRDLGAAVDGLPFQELNRLRAELAETVLGPSKHA